MIELALIALVVLAALAIIYSAAASAVRKHGAAALIWRHFTGHHYDGEHRTDAGWTVGGTRVFTKTGRASAWAHRPRAYRAAVRGGGTLAVLGALAGWLVAPGLTELAVILAGVVLVALGAWRTYDGIRTWRHVRRHVRPLHVALGRALGYPLGVSPRSWLDVPRDYAEQQGARITVRLHEGFNSVGEDSRRLVREIVATVLALESPSATWHLAGRNPSVIFTVAVPPPDKVLYAEVQHLIAAAKETAPLLGLGRGRAPIAADLDQDSPHILLSMGSGAGKSVAARGITAQVLNHGGLALILDVKRLSHTWARQLPSARTARSAEEIHHALLWLSAELERRNTLADENATIDGDVDPELIGPRIIVVCEELNATVQRLNAYWRSIRTKDDPTQSPAIDALAEASYMGRAVKINLLLIGQLVTARSVGGPEIRESAGTRLLGRYTQNAARMLCPEIWPFPKSSRKPGRIQAYVGGSLHETQLTFMTPAEARELASSGTVSLFPGQSQGSEAASAAAPVRLHVARSAPPIGLRQAVSEGVVPIGLEALRSARARDPEFPEARAIGPGGEQLYDRDELAAWSGNRPKAAKAAGE